MSNKLILISILYFSLFLIYFVFVSFFVVCCLLALFCFPPFFFYCFGINLLNSVHVFHVNVHLYPTFLDVSEPSDLHEIFKRKTNQFQV